MRVIVTGGAGFIGSNICDALGKENHEVCVIDNLSDQGGGRREHVPSEVRFEEVDIRDKDAVDRVFAGFKPEVVCHHAAQTSVVRSTRDPHYDADVNVMGTITLLEAAAKANARKVVFASTAATYGTVDTLPIDETLVQRPLSPYGMTKLIDEQYLRFFSKQRDLEFTVLRYGNVYGPHQNPFGEGGVVAIFTAKFIKKEGIKINGDGEQTRDFTFVGDIARLNVLALTRGANEAYVVGTGIPTSVNEIYRSLVEITGFEAPVTPGPHRPSEARASYFTPIKAKRDLHWAAEVSLLEGLRQTVAYYSSALGSLSKKSFEHA